MKQSNASIKLLNLILIFLIHTTIRVYINNIKGFALLKLGRHDDALQSMEKALDINPNYWIVILNKGNKVNNESFGLRR
jgi:tetratricopeptide (TPR) repeat protein